MKKVVKAFALLLVMGACFLLGWRVMPKVWPTLKTQVVYRVLPQLQPAPTPVVTPTPYQPVSNAAFGDPIAAQDSLVYYFYKEYCPYCAQLEPLMAALPERSTLPDGSISPVKLVCLNKNDEAMGQVVADFYADFAIPEERQYVPAVVIGGRYLMPGSEIIDQLLEALLAGEGLATPLLNGAQRMP